MADVFGDNQCSDQKDTSRSWEFLYGRAVGDFRRGSCIKLVLRAPCGADIVSWEGEGIFGCCAVSHALGLQMKRLI